MKLARQVLALLTAALTALTLITVLPGLSRPPGCVRTDSPAGVHVLIVVENCAP